MKTGNQHINKTANNHKRNDIYIQPNQTEEACVCVQVMVVIRSVSRAETPTCVSTSDQIRSGYTAVNELMNIIVFRERERGGGREGGG